MAVSLTELKRLIQSPNATDDDVQIYATHGQLVVTEYLAGSTLSTAIQNQIALLLSAHFAVITREYGGLRRAKKGESEEQYQPIASDKVGFLTTRFGQQACALDTTGLLTSMSQQWNSAAIIEAIRPPCE